jgi:hypothetical protein
MAATLEQLSASFLITDPPESTDKTSPSRPVSPNIPKSPAQHVTFPNTTEQGTTCKVVEGRTETADDQFRRKPEAEDGTLVVPTTNLNISPNDVQKSHEQFRSFKHLFAIEGLRVYCNLLEKLELQNMTTLAADIKSTLSNLLEAIELIVSDSEPKLSKRFFSDKDPELVDWVDRAVAVVRAKDKVQLEKMIGEHHRLITKQWLGSGITAEVINPLLSNYFKDG